MPSDTFAAGIEAAISCARDEGAPEKDIAVFRLAYDYLLCALKAPTDTDTAIPAGGSADHRAHHVFDRWDKPPHAPAYWFHLPSWVQEYATACVTATEQRLTAASPKPDTDTPVDPGVEGVDKLIGRLQQRAATYSWDSNIFYASDAELMRKAAAALDGFALAVKPIAGMDAGEVEGSIAPRP